MGIKHKYISPTPDDTTNPDDIKPQRDWNDEHEDVTREDVSSDFFPINRSDLGDVFPINRADLGNVFPIEQADLSTDLIAYIQSLVSGPTIPTANFSFNTQLGNTPLSVIFTNTSTNTVTYEWDFGDGTTSNLENPTHIYSNPGVYTVKLTCGTNEVYSIKTLSNQIVVTTPLSAVFNLNWLSGIPNGWTELSGAWYSVSNSFGHNSIQCNAPGEITYPFIQSSIAGEYDLRHKAYSAGASETILKIYNNTDFYGLDINYGTSTISVIKSIDGTQTTIGTPYTFVADTNPHISSFIIDALGNILVKFDGTTVITTSDTSLTSCTQISIDVLNSNNFPGFDYVDITLSASATPPNVERFLTNPVLPWGVGTWASTNQCCARIIDINNETRMYHLGMNPAGYCGIGYAIEGNDLSSFSESAYNPFSNLGTNIRMGNIIQIGDLYYLYYGTEPATDINVATSPDGIEWTPHTNNPILSPNGTDEVCINLPYVLLIDGTYYMYYTNYNTSAGDPAQFRVASSPDGLVWTEEGIVLNVGASPDWDDIHIEDKTVYVFDGEIYLFYEGYNNTEWCIGLAKSTTPTGMFTKSINNPIFSPSGVIGSFDEYHVATPYPYFINGNMFLFYSGANNPVYGSAQWSMGAALIHDITQL